MLKVTALSVSYGTRQALKKITFSLEAGTILAVIGPNGAGKTTLVRALSGVLPLKDGIIEVMGRNLFSLSPAERARLIAVVPQARNLPPAFSGRETVQLGRTPHLNWLGQLSASDEAIIHQAMERTQTLALADRPVGELSGGEQQRLLLARALAQSAPVLLLDEPTTHLDLQFQIHLLDLVRTLTQQDGLTVLAALHDLNLVGRFADQVALLVDGELRALGSPQVVLDPQILEQAYNLPLQVISSPAGGYPLVIPRLLL